MAYQASRDTRQFVAYPTEYYLSDLLDTQSHHLPILVYILDGYQGNSELETVASGQVKIWTIMILNENRYSHKNSMIETQQEQKLILCQLLDYFQYILITPFVFSCNNTDLYRKLMIYRNEFHTLR